MLDIINRRATDLSDIRYLVLDEADEMLNMGFQEDINSILSNTPASKRTWLFSATMPNEVKRISRNYMTDPAEITVGGKNRSEEHTSELQSLMRISYAVFCLKKKTTPKYIK